MASFNAQSISQMDNLEQIKSYLYKLNEQLTYMFGNLDPDDNYSDYALNIYKSDGKKVLEIAASLNEVKLEMVKEGEIISAINMSEEQIRILANKIKLEGTVTANNNFVIYEDGSIEAKNAKFSGVVAATGGKIGGVEIIGNTLNSSNFDDAQIDFGSVIIDDTGLMVDNFFIGGEEIWTMNALLASYDGNLYVNNSTYFNGWTVADALDELRRLFGSGGCSDDCDDCSDGSDCSGHCDESLTDDIEGGC